MYFPRIRDLRTDNDLKQETLARHLHVTQATYSEYESGKINLPVEAALFLADFYNVSLDYLLSRSNDAAPFYPKSHEVEK